MFGFSSQDGSVLSKRFVHLAVIALLGLLVYSNTFNVPFQFDDIPNISENQLIRDFSSFLDPPKSTGWDVNWAFPGRYIGYLTFALNYHLHRLDVQGYHAVNILIHLINAFLVYALVVLSFRTPHLARSSTEIDPQLPAFIAALFFSLHPVQTQAVTYIVQRFASLATLFYLSCMVLYIKARLSKGRKQWLLYAGAFVSAVLAMKTKEIAATLPLAVMLYEFMFFEGAKRKRLLLILPFAITVLLIPLSFVSFDQQISDMFGDAAVETKIQTDMSRSAYLFTQLRVIVTYTRLLFLPVNQTLEYDIPIYSSIGEPAAFLSLILLAAILSAGVLMLRRSLRPQGSMLRPVSFGLFFFFLALSSESGMVPIIDVIFEHRMYLPMAGVAIAFATGFVFLKSRMNRGSAISAMVILILTLSSATYARNTVWQSDISLWEDVVSKAPNKMRPHINLGEAYGKRGMFEKARAHYELVTRLKPGMYANTAKDIAKGYTGLGTICMYQGKVDEAIVNYDRAIQIKPDYVMAYYDLGIAYGNKGMHEEAIQQFRKAIAIEPEMADAHFNLGMAYVNKGMMEEAVKQVMKTLRFDPSHKEAKEFMHRLGRLG